MNSKTEFLENISSPEKDYSKCFVFEICRNEKFSIQNLVQFGIFSFNFSLCRKTFASESDYFFFWKFHFKLWFSMKKVPTKSCLLKWVRKVSNLLFCAEQIESKPYFLDVMFLSKSDPQWKLNSKSKFQKKILSPQNDYWEIFFRNPPERKTLDSKTDHFVGKNFNSKFEFCFRKFRFKLLFSMKKLASKSCFLK